MPRIDPSFVCHKLSISPEVKSVTPKKSWVGEEKRKAMREETKKLADAGVIIEIDYTTWLANVVLVKKLNRK